MKKNKKNEKKHKESLTEKGGSSKEKNKSVFKYYLAIFLLGIISIFLLKKISDAKRINTMKTKIIPEAVRSVVNNPKVKFKVESVKKTSGVYEFKLDFNKRKYTSYITTDGKILFTSGIKLALLKKVENKKNTTQTQNKKLSCKDLKKTSSPKLEAFVVSNCPFGLQMQRVFEKTIKEAPWLSKYLKIRYIGSVSGNKITSMHGDKEAQENLRQICIREEQANKYWPYLGCYMQQGETEKCLKQTGINVNKLNACVKDSKRGLAYAKKDFNLAAKLGVGASPTLILDEVQKLSEFDFGGRVPNAIKNIVCCAFKNKPAVCKKDLSKKQVATSFSKTGEVKGAGGSASCD